MPKLIDKPAPGVLRYLAASIAGVDDMRAVLEHAAGVLDVRTSALHVSEANGVITIRKVSMETSPTSNLRLVK